MTRRMTDDERAKKAAEREAWARSTTVPSLHGEVWAPVAGWEEFYEVSNMGRVKSLVRCSPGASPAGAHVRWWPEGIMAPHVHAGDGHQRVQFWRLGSTESRFIHRLVLEAFVGPCPEGMEACHNDGNPANNRLDNLRWDTRASNHADKRRHGNLVAGERHPCTRQTADTVLRIRRLRADGLSPTQIAAEIGSTVSLVDSAIRSWKHLTENQEASHGTQTTDS